MNQISWLIYIANIAENIGGILVFIGILIVAISGIYFVVSMGIYSDIERWDSSEVKTRELKNARKMRRFVPFLVCVSFVIWIIAACCPSQETVLAIAASQAGEQLLKTPTANLAEKALDAWLRRQINVVPK